MPKRYNSLAQPEGWGLPSAYVIAAGALVSLALAFMLGSAVVRSHEMRDSESPTSAVNISAQARKHVEERLMTGRIQVEFPAVGEDQIEPIGTNLVQVTSWVDSRNTNFGAITRTRYSLLMRHEGQNRWTVEGLSSRP